MAKNLVQYYATGRRKTAAARVFLRPGTGKVSINARTLDVYFVRPVLRMVVKQPLVLLNTAETYDMFVTVKGGGLTGQAGAIQLGIARCLVEFNDELRKPLRDAGYLTRDPRMVERKKYGQPKARKKFQFSKR